MSNKNSFRRNSVTYGTPCHAIGHFVFWFDYVTYRMPCYTSGHLVIYRECCGFERAFLLSGVFYLTLLPAGFKASLGADSSISKLPGFLWNIAPARLFAWFTAIHKRFICGRYYLRFMAGRLRNEEFATYGNWTLFAIGEHARGLMLYPFGHWAMQFETNQSSSVCCNLCFRSF